MKVTKQWKAGMQWVTMCYNDLFLVQCIPLLKFINYSTHTISKEFYMTPQKERNKLLVNLIE